MCSETMDSPATSRYAVSGRAWLRILRRLFPTPLPLPGKATSVSRLLARFPREPLTLRGLEGDGNGDGDGNGGRDRRQSRRWPRSSDTGNSSAPSRPDSRDCATKIPGRSRGERVSGLGCRVGRFKRAVGAASESEMAPAEHVLAALPWRPPFSFVSVSLSRPLERASASERLEWLCSARCATFPSRRRTVVVIFIARRKINVASSRLRIFVYKYDCAQPALFRCAAKIHQLQQ